MDRIFNSEFKRRAAMTIATAMTLVYLIYRAAYTLNLSSPYAVVASLLLYVPECYGSLLMFLFFFQVWTLRNPEPVPPLLGRKVDVMIPTYNEDPELLRGTILASLKIDYPHRTLVLDDGKRASVAELCRELGAEYVTRPTNLHAKAGNLNHALEMTDGEFIIIFDADHIAERHFIDRLIGYFADDKLGFVQTPHAFYNFDAYQGTLDYQRGVYWEEGMLFYNVLQPGKNYWNGVTFCGSAAMFRRKALEEVGLIATQSITEDMHTGLRMHAKGWKSLFVNERLIAAVAADDVTSFNTQRLRWGEGNLGIFAFDNPLTIPGLTFAQRLCYLGSMLSWTTGVQKLLVYLAPLLMLLTEVAPVANFGPTLAVLTALYMVSVWFGVKVASNGYGQLWSIELTQMACFWVQTKATWRAIFGRRKAKFVVTAKRGRQSNSLLRQVMPQIIYVVASLVAIAWAATRLLLHLSDDLVGPLVGGTLLVLQASMAWIVICRALRPKERRESWRHPGALHVTFRADKGGGQMITGQGVTRDIHERGVGLVTFEELPENASVELAISACGRTVECRGAVRFRAVPLKHASARHGLAQAYRYGIEFQELSGPQLETLWWLGAQYNVSRQYEHFEGGQFGLGPVAARRLPAAKDEQAFSLPFTVEKTDRQIDVGVTEMIGPHTLTALLPAELPSSEKVKLRVATPFGQVQAWGEIEDVRSRSIAGEMMHETRIRYRRFFAESRSQLQSTLGHSSSPEVEQIVHQVPGRRPMARFRPAILVCSTAATAALIVLGACLFVRRDEALIARVEAGGIVSPAQVDRLSSLALTLGDSPNIDEARTLRLRAVMMQLGREREVRAIDEVIARDEPHTLDGRILKAVTLADQGKRAEAELVFGDLLTRLDETADGNTRSEVLLAAARNAANLERHELAIDRFEQLAALGDLGDDARREFAGVLVKGGERERGLKLIDTGEQSVEDLRLLASIYASEQRFDLAMATYRRLLAVHGDDVLALRGLADNAFWAHDFALAAQTYRAVAERLPNDDSLPDRVAESLLFGREFTLALEAYTAQLQRHPDRTELWPNFLAAATGSRAWRETDRRVLDTIFHKRVACTDIAFQRALLGAVATHGERRQLIPLLEAALVTVPTDANLRLRLADALHDQGRFAEAELHYAWLLAHPTPEPIAPAPFDGADNRR